MTRKTFNTEEERQIAKKEYKKKYYQENKHKQLIYNMRYRHRVNPPKYINDLNQLIERKNHIRRLFSEENAILDREIERLNSWNPLEADSLKPQKIKIVSKNMKIVFE